MGTTRRATRTDITPAWVYQKYVVEGLSWAAIYREHGVSPTRLARFLRETGYSRKRSSWNADTKGLTKANRTSFKVGQPGTRVFGRHVPVQGEHHWNWKGGITRETIRLRQSADYRDWRKAVFERDDYTCQHCRERGGRLSADHIKPWSTHPALRYEVSNGRTLCWPKCHRVVGWSPWKDQN